jgi:hypothetical protein
LQIEPDFLLIGNGLPNSCLIDGTNFYYCRNRSPNGFINLVPDADACVEGTVHVTVS